MGLPPHAKSSAMTLVSVQRETTLVHRYSLSSPLCGWDNYSRMYAIPPDSFYWCHMEKWSKSLVAYAETKEYSHSLERAPKDRFAAPVKSTDKTSALMNHQASMYEFWYLGYFQNPSFHIDQWRSSILYESKGYDLSIWNRKTTTVHSRRKTHGKLPTDCICPVLACYNHDER